MTNPENATTSNFRTADLASALPEQPHLPTHGTHDRTPANVAGCSLSATLLWAQPTIAAISDDIAGVMSGSNGKAQ
ncbi:hypothetical protein [Nonomuraea sp. NPDC049695]|uniref:hypothetical protein n=1 Tax=Nonomuraea sp. NPDC049695 TaxID=3154734 RepID=UPI00341E29C6